MTRSSDLLRDVEGGIEIAVLVVPRSRRPGITGIHGGALRVRVAAPPQGGRANREAARLVADAVGGRESRVVRGRSSRRKWIAVADVDASSAVVLLRAAGVDL